MRRDAHRDTARPHGAGTNKEGTGVLRLIRAANGMNIVGQGLKIMLFTAPSAVAAVLLHMRTPALVSLPMPEGIRLPLAIGFLAAGLVLWLMAVVQLLIGFPKGKLVTTGAYRVCRNPIYSSFALLLLPGAAFLLGTWVYLVVSLFLCAGVQVFIRTEERQLVRVFGNEYEAYTRRVSRLIPFLEPSLDGRKA